LFKKKKHVTNLYALELELRPRNMWNVFILIRNSTIQFVW